jgi:hypothetical protein
MKDPGIKLPAQAAIFCRTAADYGLFFNSWKHTVNEIILIFITYRQACFSPFYHFINQLSYCRDV